MHLVISLDRTPSRWKAVSERFLAAVGVSPVRVSAIDKEDLSGMRSVLEGRPRFRHLSYGELACFLSHKKCWETLLRSDEEWALVMEDDIYFSPKAKALLSSSDWIPEGVDVCQVASYKKEPERCWVDSKSVIEVGDRFSLKKMMRPTSYGTQAYWINRRAAEEALALTKQINQPVDHFMFDQWDEFCKSVSVYSLFPFVVYQDYDLPSIIDEDRKQFKEGEKSLSERFAYFVFKTKIKLMFSKTKRKFVI